MKRYVVKKELKCKSLNYSGFTFITKTFSSGMLLDYIKRDGFKTFEEAHNYLVNTVIKYDRQTAKNFKLTYDIIEVEL